MSIIRWTPRPTFQELDTFHDDVNRLFESFFTPAAPAGESLAFVPPTDLEETPEAFLVRLDLPGVRTEDVKVSLLGDTLTIRGERKHTIEKQEGALYRRERRYGTFERSFHLGRAVKSAEVQANFRDGVLEIRVPKADEARTREIQIQVK